MSKQMTFVLSKEQTEKNRRIIAKVNEAAREWIFDILLHVAIIPDYYLDGDKKPCPRCRGLRRFFMVGSHAHCEGVFCCRCFTTENWDIIKTVSHFRGVKYSEALRLIVEFLRQVSADIPFHVVNTRTYTDESGNPMYYIDHKERMVNGKLEKKSVWYYPKDIAKRVQSDLIPKMAFPFNLKAINERTDESIYFVADEKCCDALTAFGLLATTVNGVRTSKLPVCFCGYNCTPEICDEYRFYWFCHFQNRHAIIIPDTNRFRFERATDNANRLFRTNCTVQIVNLPGLQEGEDVVDWIERGGTRNKLEKIVAATPVVRHRPVQ